MTFDWFCIGSITLYDKLSLSKLFVTITGL